MGTVRVLADIAVTGGCSNGLIAVLAVDDGRGVLALVRRCLPDEDRGTSIDGPEPKKRAARRSEGHQRCQTTIRTVTTSRINWAFSGSPILLAEAPAGDRRRGDFEEIHAAATAALGLLARVFPVDADTPP